MADYRIVHAETIGKLTDAVKNLMEQDGWHPAGGVVSDRISPTDRYLQAMVKP